MAQHSWRVVSVPESFENNGATEWRVSLERAQTEEQ